MKQEILGVQVSKINMREALDVVKQCVVFPRLNYIVTPNPEFIVRAQKDKIFRDILNNAVIALPDGFGLMLAAKFLKRSLDQRITGVDFIWHVAELAEQEEYSIYLYGAGKGIAKKTAEKLMTKYPHLKIVGAESGYDKNGKMNDALFVEDIRKKSPDILLVALGAPKQEKWIVTHLPDFTGVKVAMGVGGAFDYISGSIKRAPEFIRKMGLEWLYRLIIQPWRIKRIFTATIHFSYLVIKVKIMDSRLRGNDKQ
ncbi:MAG: WecB/TagA/CpsF family glycosyltransferase [Patescibacteria group bacterium]|jgi:N-acetylglucosaminyldiphosphoundecaprenol N-acetyl-beta-D-mannosaminyltransferase